MPSVYVLSRRMASLKIIEFINRNCHFDEAGGEICILLKRFLSRSFFEMTKDETDE